MLIAAPAIAGGPTIEKGSATKMRSTSFMSVALAATLSACSVLTPEMQPLPVAATADGTSQADLTRNWRQWAASFDSASSPVADRTGERCGNGQSGAVWFLAGTYGSSAVHRTCRMPAGKQLFFPLINYVVMPRYDHSIPCKEARLTAHEITDSAMGLFAELDGRSFTDLAAHRVATTECFNVAARSSGAPDLSPSASDGYWLLLPPLPAGTHHLRFGGSLPSLRQDLEYTLVVE
jgi:hypothetical protein